MTANGVPMAVIHGQDHAIQQPELTDAMVASAVRALLRTHFDHEAICTLARDRILYLSQRLEKAEVLLAEVVREPGSDWSADINSFLALPKTKPSIITDVYKRP